MKDYYQILEIPRGATLSEIKRSYRKIALSCHPDKNPDPKANIKFLDVNEAYSVLSDPLKRQEYDQKFNYGTFEWEERIIREDSRKRRYREYIKKEFFKRRHAEQVNFSDYSIYARIISWVTFIFCVIILFDFFLATNFKDELVTSKLYATDANNYIGYTTIETRNASFPLNYGISSKVHIGDFVDVSITPIFRIVKHIDIYEGGHIITFQPYYSIYNIFAFFPVILFISSALGIGIKGNDEFIFNAAVANFFLGIIVLVLSLLS